MPHQTSATQLNAWQEGDPARWNVPFRLADLKRAAGRSEDALGLMQSHLVPCAVFMFVEADSPRESGGRGYCWSEFKPM